jgi:hypothetical protein
MGFPQPAVLWQNQHPPEEQRLEATKSVSLFDLSVPSKICLGLQWFMRKSA